MAYIDQINELNESYKTGALKVSHKEYMKRYKSLARKHKKATRPSLSDKMRAVGIRVTKTDFGYRYNGKNFKADVWLDGCETSYWTVSPNDDMTEAIQNEITENFYKFDRKKDAISALFQYDINL